jgi:hypothetical protein
VQIRRQASDRKASAVALRSTEATAKCHARKVAACGGHDPDARHGHAGPGRGAGKVDWERAVFKSVSTRVRPIAL